jgi:hypothetical protein
MKLAACPPKEVQKKRLRKFGSGDKEGEQRLSVP